MKDIIIEKNQKKAIERFEDLFTSRKEIIKDGKKELPKTDYLINQKQSQLHPKKIKTRIKRIIEEQENIKSLILEPVDVPSFPEFIPGAYIAIEINYNNLTYVRPYPINSSKKNLKEYKITIKDENDLTKYLLNNYHENDEIIISSPQNLFHYNEIRDEKKVIFICDEEGFFGIFGIMEDLLLEKKVEKIDLIYNVKTVSEFIWKKELDEWQKKYKNFTITYMLREEKRENYITGVIDEEIMLKQNPIGKTIFVSGSNKLYESLNEILKKLDIPNKYIRVNMYATRLKDRMRINHSLTIIKNGIKETIPCYENETLLESIEKNGLKIETSCTVGICGYCKSKLIEGEIKTEPSGLRKKDLELKYIHPCVTYPDSDVTIEIP